jgi:hypothetical protein
MLVLPLIGTDHIGFTASAKEATERWASAAARTNRGQRIVLHERHANCASAAIGCSVRRSHPELPRQPYLTVTLRV